MGWLIELLLGVYVACSAIAGITGLIYMIEQKIELNLLGKFLFFVVGSTGIIIVGTAFSVTYTIGKSIELLAPYTVKRKEK